jgi:hypothetical protein
MTKKILYFTGRVLLLLCLLSLGIVYLVKRPSIVFSQLDQTEKYVEPSDLKMMTKELSENFLPRNFYHPENLIQTASYIESKFKSFDLNTELQTYEINGNLYVNVIASLGPETEDIVVVGAHYDAYSSYAGADDNASGVAGLLELSRLLSKSKLKNRVILVAYTCEEPPQFGSEKMGSYIHASSIQGKNIEIMISLEMIGYFSEKEDSQSFPLTFLKYLYPKKGDYIAVVGQINSTKAMKLKDTINKYTDLEAFSINAPSFVAGVDFSDHRNYWKHGYPAVMVTDTAFYRNKNYHKASDTYDKLNYDLMAKVVYGVFKYVQEL